MLKGKAVWAVVAAQLMMGAAGVAAEKPADQGGTRVETQPVGAMVYLFGEYRLAGRAPFVIQKPLSGPYEIKASKHGYEGYSATHYFQPGRAENLSIRLTRKTRLRALVRSMFVPGWGQYYGEQKFKAVVIGSAQLVSGLYLLWADSRYQKAVDRFNTAVRNFKTFEKSAELRDQFIQDILTSQKDVDQRYDLRKRALIVAASIYAYNLLDALILFPSFKEEPPIRMKLAVQPAGGEPNVGIGLQAKF